jgi:cell division protein FtsB
MRSRRRTSSTVSLFAFQDVMASVIGILFFLVLILALDIVTEKSTGGVLDVDVPDDSTLIALRDAVREYSQRREQLHKEIEGLTDSIRFLTTADPQSALSEVRDLKRQLDSLYERIRKDQDDLVAASDRSTDKASTLHAERDKLKRTNKHIAQLEKRMQGGESRPRVTYIIDESGDEMTAWLVEIDSARIRVGSKDGRAAAMMFEATPFDIRKEQFLAWAQVQDRSSHYFVLLIKPSGIEHAGALFNMLTNKPPKFQVGTDLIPETWVSFE